MEWSNTQKLRGNSVYTTVIGEDESGIYVMKHRNRFLSKFVVFERYRHNLGLELTKSFLLKDTRIIYSDINERGILIIKLIFDKKNKNYKIMAELYNNSFEYMQPETILGWTNHPLANAEPTLIVKPSPDHKHYLILNYGLTATPQNFNRFIIIDRKMNTLESGEIKFEKNWDIESIGDVVFDKSLKISILLTLKKNKEELNYLGVYEQSVFKQLKDSGSSFEKPLFYYNALTNEKGVSGYYTSQLENGYEGDFSYSWKNISSDSIRIKKNPFSKSILKTLGIETKAQTGYLSTSYSPLKLICRSDGGFVKISENAYTLREQDVIMVNGVASSQGKNIFSFENLLIQNFDSSGKLTWENCLTKNQNTVNDGGLLGSVHISATESSINIVYNDPIATGGDIVITSISPNGQQQLKVAANGEEMNAFIIPAEGKQISDDKIIVPVLKDRKFALLKITFKQ